MRFPKFLSGRMISLDLEGYRRAERLLRAARIIAEDKTTNIENTTEMMALR